jgi:hypothetical protein
LEKSSRYAAKGTKQEEDPLAPLRRAMEGIADMAQAVAKLQAEPSEANLRDLGREMNEARRSMQSLGRVLMLSQDPTLAARAHELVAEAKEAMERAAAGEGNPSEDGGYPRRLWHHGR